jgi:phage baseplate assembly protein W
VSRIGVGPSGEILTGLDHVIDCVGTILSTEIGSRVQRRDFGSDIPALIDRPQNSETLVDFIMAVAEALEPRRVRGRWYGEPGFRLEWCGIDVATPGTVELMVSGDYLPRGHLGDLTVVESGVKFSVPLSGAVA